MIEIARTFLECLLALLLLYVAASAFYHFALAVAYFLAREPARIKSGRLNRFAVVVPAHNEELLISRFCENLAQLSYPAEKYAVHIIADNCTDDTAALCSRYPVRVLCRSDLEHTGKGYALKWAFENIDLNRFDAVLVLDADTTVEPSILHELNSMINNGSRAVQCHIRVPNRDESWFTQLIHVSRTINGLLYHYSKYKLGLSAYLMGTGMCFRADLLQKQPWTAFTLSEDWEYFARLIEQGVKIDFARQAVVLQQESRSLQQATSQRLRWSKGRFYVIKSLGLKLFFRGILRKSLIMTDASLALLFPNWSLQVNLILTALAGSLFLEASPFKTTALVLGSVMLVMQAVILAAGAVLAGDIGRVAGAVLVSPLFLVWKFFIDLASLTGIYRGREWIRTARHVPHSD
jgi:cellulose synthase/poly-beta-1,6-N-acetylglucosamine synthase-like glycosyltransferase